MLYVHIVRMDVLICLNVPAAGDDLCGLHPTLPQTFHKYFDKVKKR